MKKILFFIFFLKVSYKKFFLVYLFFYFNIFIFFNLIILLKMGICNSIDNKKINNNYKEISKILFSKIKLIGKGGYGKVRIKNIISNLNLNSNLGMEN